MKKAILTSVLAAMVSVAANASDGGMYYETETVAAPATEATATYVEPRPVVVAAPRRPTCNKCGQAFRVKTYTEVVDHYQVYKPVVVYQPVGEYAKRRVVSNKSCGCNKCK